MSDKVYTELPTNINTLEKEKFTLDDDGYVEIRVGEGSGTTYTELPTNINTLEKEKFALDDDGHVVIRTSSSGGGMLEFPTSADFPAVGKAGMLYLAINTGVLYRFDTDHYVEISTTLSLGETSTTAYRGDRGKTAYDHSQTTHDKAFVGLGNVDNTSDANKPVSTAQATAIGVKVTAPASSVDNSIARFDGTTGKLIQDASLCYIDDSGNLSVNTTDVTGKVNIKGSGATSATKSLIVRNSANTEVLTACDCGNVGIGTSSPTATLHIQGTDATAVDNAIPQMKIVNLSTTSSFAFIKTSIATGYTFGYPEMWMQSSVYGGVSINELRGVSNHPIAIRTNNVERMRIDAAGNVGIGTNAPTAKLDINSDIIRLRTAKTPASATAVGNAGDICWDASYVYICTATNTWKRVAITTW